jgi:iron(III) transport system substrate-binding protein
MTAAISRRTLLSTVGATIALPAAPRAQTLPPPSKVTPELIAAAVQEGKVTQYTSNDLSLATAMAKAFEAKYPGITFQLERSGAERNFQRISQEYASNVRVADVVTSSDLSYLVSWKKSGMTVAYQTEEAAGWGPAARDADGFFTKEIFSLMIPGYNTRLVREEEAPKAWTDLLDPRWKGKMVKAHPGYSGNIMTGTYALIQALGWGFYEKLATQRVMQVQSATDPPFRCAQGERAVMADASENAIFRTIKNGGPLAPIYPVEGSPVVPVGCAIMAAAPHPNAARLLVHFILSPEGQKILVDYGGRSFAPGMALPPGLKPSDQVKLLHSDPVEVAAQTDAIRKRYAQLFI